MLNSLEATFQNYWTGKFSEGVIRCCVIIIDEQFKLLDLISIHIHTWFIYSKSLYLHIN